MPVIERLTADAALSRAQAAIGGRAQQLHVNLGHLELWCRPADLVDVVTTLRDAEGLAFRFFTFLSAIDRSELEEGGGLEVLIHLYSPEHAAHVNIHVPVDADNPRCPTISGLFAGALWHERECHEMFGVVFEGHPKLVGLYLPEDFQGHPGLRSFKLPSRNLIKEWPGA
ncbi:MAG TPA: NADH-quinone oxidoreductase subunit C, partial [Actinomycetota bacterium]|nr:NADH-quinone oxidoreductase subunit C [Actinomycetota bacterium]